MLQRDHDPRFTCTWRCTVLFINGFEAALGKRPSARRKPGDFSRPDRGGNQLQSYDLQSNTIQECKARGLRATGTADALRARLEESYRQLVRPPSNSAASTAEAAGAIVRGDDGFTLADGTGKQAGDLEGLFSGLYGPQGS